MEFVEQHYDAADVSQILSAVMKNFLDSLPMEEATTFQNFSNPESMIEEIEAKCKDRINPAVSGFSKTIAGFADKFQLLFGAIDIFVSSYPD